MDLYRRANCFFFFRKRRKKALVLINKHYKPSPKILLGIRYGKVQAVLTLVFKYVTYVMTTHLVVE